MRSNTSIGAGATPDLAGAGSLALVLRGGRVACDSHGAPARLDVLIGQDGRIADLVAGAPEMPGTPELRLDGGLVTTGLVDVHQHLDKTGTRDAIANPDGTLIGAIKGYSAYVAKSGIGDLARRAAATVDACIARGTVALRSHANIDTDMQSHGARALIELREHERDRIRIQVVGFVTAGAAGMLDQAKTWLDEAVAAGINVVGGAPAFADEPAAMLDLLFRTAAEQGLPIDLHLDEHLDADRHHFDLVLDRTREYGLEGRVVVGHASVLGALPRDEVRRIAGELAAARIGVITLPAANLYLQGRDSDRLPPRGLAPIRDLMAAGVQVAAASDNIQDPFVPTGSGDMLEIARWTMVAGHLDPNDMGALFEMVTTTPAQFMGLGTEFGLSKGARADLLITRAQDVANLVAGGALERTVLFGGKPVSGRQ